MAYQLRPNPGALYDWQLCWPANDSFTVMHSDGRSWPVAPVGHVFDKQPLGKTLSIWMPAYSDIALKAHLNNVFGLLGMTDVEGLAMVEAEA